MGTGQINLGTTGSIFYIFPAFSTNLNLLQSYNGSAYTTEEHRASDYSFKIGTSTGLILNTSGNLGLGVTPSAWNGIYRVFQIDGGSISSSPSYNNISVASNVFYNAGNSPRYIVNDYATLYGQDDGLHAWYTAPSGTAGNAITFTQAMTLTKGGEVGIGVIPSSGNRFWVKGNDSSSSNTSLITQNAAGTITFLVRNDGTAAFSSSATFGSYVSVGNTGSLTKLNVNNAVSGAILPYIQGTGLSYNSEGISVAGSNTNNTNIGNGITFYNNVASVNAYAPVIAFSSMTVGGAYNATYAFITGVYTGAGGDNNWAVGDLIFGTGNSYGASERMRLTSAGNVQFKGYNEWFNGATSRFIISRAVDIIGGGDDMLLYTQSGINMQFWTGGYRRMGISTNGAVSINTSSTGTFNPYLYVYNADGGRICATMEVSLATPGFTTLAFVNPNGIVGSVAINTSSTSYNTASDYRLKENLKDFNALDKVSRIKVYDFKWKTDTERNEGVLAHELQDVVPYAVVGEKDAVNEDNSIKSQMVDYSKLVPILTKALQEANAKITSLEEKLQRNNIN